MNESYHTPFCGVLLPLSLNPCKVTVERCPKSKGEMPYASSLWKNLTMKVAWIFDSRKKLAGSHRPLGQFSSLSVKSDFKGTDVCLKMVSQTSLLAYWTPRSSTMVAHHRWLALLYLLTGFQAKQISFIRAKHPATAIKYLGFVVPLTEVQHCSSICYQWHDTAVYHWGTN